MWGLVLDSKILPLSKSFSLDASCSGSTHHGGQPTMQKPVFGCVLLKQQQCGKKRIVATAHNCSVCVRNLGSKRGIVQSRMILELFNRYTTIPRFASVLLYNQSTIPSQKVIFCLKKFEELYFLMNRQSFSLRKVTFGCDHMLAKRCNFSSLKISQLPPKKFGKLAVCAHIKHDLM